MANIETPKTYDIFKSDGRLKGMQKFQKDFLRPAYQYTSQEIRNWQREEREKRKAMFLNELYKQAQINGCISNK